MKPQWLAHGGASPGLVPHLPYLGVMWNLWTEFIKLRVLQRLVCLSPNDSRVLYAMTWIGYMFCMNQEGPKGISIALPWSLRDIASKRIFAKGKKTKPLTAKNMHCSRMQTFYTICRWICSFLYLSILKANNLFRHTLTRKSSCFNSTLVQF